MFWNAFRSHGNRTIAYKAKGIPLKRILLGSTLILSTAGTIYYWPEISFLTKTSIRTVRTAETLFAILQYYKKDFPKEEGEHERKSQVHEMAAQRLLKLFQKNGGIYIKLGQHLSALEYILPPEYCRTMNVLHNQAPTSTLEEVQQVFQDELEMKLEQVFEVFDPIPIGAASLAQVHRAQLKDTGELVAVKVQHHRLQPFIEIDMFTVSVAVKIIKYLFPEFQLEWLADEMKQNLPKELDFTSEGHNAERLSRLIRQSSDLKSGIKIPKIHWNLTRNRILVMEYCNGVKITNKEYMIKEGINPKSIAQRLVKLYSEMIFLYGFVHCDPHPGNVLVNRLYDSSDFTRPSFHFRWNPFRRRVAISSVQWELVLLDHGLYRELPDEFRTSYARLWKTIIDGGPEANIQKYVQKLAGNVDIGNAYKLFSCILTQRNWNSVSSGIVGTSRNTMEFANIQDKIPEHIGKISDLLSKLPRHILLLLKTNDLLQSVERNLVDRPTFSYLIMAHYCLKAIYEDDISQLHSLDLFPILKSVFRYWIKDLKLNFIELLYWLLYKLRPPITPPL